MSYLFAFLLALPGLLQPDSTVSEGRRPTLVSLEGGDIQFQPRNHSDRAGAVAPADTVRPLLLVSSGGISLGAYQAGVNWAFLSLLHQGQRQDIGLPPFDLAVATGASAGSINTLFATSEWYRPDFSKTHPEESLFWRFWTGLGIAELLPEYRDGVEPVAGGVCRRNESLLSRCYIEGTLVPELVRPALQEFGTRDADLDVSIGITVTRQEPVEVALSGDGLSVRTVRSVSAVRAQGRRGDRQRMRLLPEPALRPDDAPQPVSPLRPEKAWDPSWLGNVIHLPLVVDPERADHNLDPVTKLVMASAAFPGAWAPVRLTYAEQAQADGTIVRPDSAWFVDGGVFDNNPLTLAYLLYEYRRHDEPWEDPLAVFVDPDNVRGRGAEDHGAEPVTRGLGAVMKLLGSAVTTAREYELEVLARSLAEDDRQQLRSSSRRFPVVGVHLKAFGAFLARPFREYDFYVGAYDGFRFSARALGGCSDDDEPCLLAATASLIEASVASGALASDRVGARFVRMLLAKEHAAYDSTVERPSCTSPPLGMPSLNMEERTRCVVLAHTLHALEAADQEREAARVEGRSVGSVEHFTAFIDHLDRTEAGAIIRAWSDACPVTLGEAAAGIVCEAEPFVARLLRDPEGWLYALAFQALDPAKLVEDQEGSDAEAVVEAARLGLNMATTIQKTGFRWSDSTIPLYTDRLYGRGSYHWADDYARVALEVAVPYSAFVNGRGGVGLSYRPMWRFSLPWAAVADVQPWVQQRLFEREDADQVTGLKSTASLGVGLQYSPKPLLDIDATVTASAPWSRELREGVSVGWAAGVTLLHHIRVGWSQPEAFHSPGEFYERPGEVTVGIRDPAGLVWWAVSLLK